MEKNKTFKSWEKDFNDFLSVEEAAVPSQLTESVVSFVHTSLNPSFWAVFRNIAVIQVVVGAFSLLLCPQFGISLTSNMGLMPFLMRFGEGACMLGCGAFFTGVSLLVSGFALRPEEVRVLREHKLLQLTSLSTLSIGAFLCLGGEVIATFAFAWILGALLGGAFTLEIAWKIRQFVLVRSS